MSVKGRLVVSIWEPPPAAPPPAPLPDPHYKSPPRLIGAVASLILHAFILLAVTSNMHEVKIPSPEVVTRAVGKDGSSGELILITSRSHEQLHREYDLLAAARVTISRELLIAEARALRPSFDLDLSDVEDQALTNLGDGDLRNNDKTRWNGIYSGQMRARIERIWERPRSPVNESVDPSALNRADYFNCQVQIRQDSRGNVLEVLLPNCNGSWKWQRSLVLAIQHASPLPAPPDVSVFSNSVTLTFIGYTYAEGMSEDEYERPTSNSRGDR